MASISRQGTLSAEHAVCYEPTMRHTRSVMVLSALSLLVLSGFGRGEAGSAQREPWQIIDVRSQAVVPFDAWIETLAQQDVIYLGEEHRNQWHIGAALKILSGIIQQGQRPALAIEMFGWDGQDALDRYVTLRALSRNEFLATSRWEENWGGAFEDYEPLVAFAREHHLDVLALNPPRGLVRQVAVRGLTRALQDEEAARWQMRDEAFVRDRPYRETIVNQLIRCHGGLDADGYERMYEASLFRDEGMARTIARYLRRKSDAASGTSPVVSYTGGGHIQRNLPVPNRVLRRVPEARQVTIYLTAVTEGQTSEIDSLLQEQIADYIWLTPVGARGPAKRCK